MTTQTTTIRTSSTGLRVLIGAAATGLALLGGALLWQTRSASEPAMPAATTTLSRTSEGVAPRGGLAELYAEQQAATQAETALQARIGGMAELYRAQALTRRPLGVGATGAGHDGCGLDTLTRGC